MYLRSGILYRLIDEKKRGIMQDLQAHLSADAAKNVTDWLTKPKYIEYKQELEERIADEQWEFLEDAFFKVIEFGTGGRRGTTGIGSNRINRVTIGESAQALCLYSKSHDENAPEKGVVIACDTRLSSEELSKYAASVCAGNGFKTYIFESFRSTPDLSFAVRELGAACGIVISASHNPPADNGFKAYWSDGGQLVPPHDKGVLDAAEAVEQITAVDFDIAVEEGAITLLGEEIDKKYFAAVLAESEGVERDLRVVYSPLHGAGQTNTLPVLRKAGFTVLPVEAQMVPDGNFPTIENGKPNPEEKAANDRAVAEMLDAEAGIAITNDPDADRIGVIVRHNDEAFYLSGNQSAALATDYALKRLQERGELTPKHFIVKTIVTTDMFDALAAKYNVTCYGNLLIGFKYIGELMRKKESTDEIFVIGGEESYGLLKGSYAHDKDGAVGALPLAEYAAELKLQGKTLVDRLYELYEEIGLYTERLDTIVCAGAEGFAEMQAIMKQLREQPPTEIDGEPVTATLDYQTLTKKDVATGEESAIDGVKGNVLVFELGRHERRVTIRPSGTEPKLKFYIQWVSQTNDAEAEYPSACQKLENISRHLEGIALEKN